jgi:hypothetical protein
MENPVTQSFNALSGGDGALSIGDLVMGLIQSSNGDLSFDEQEFTALLNNLGGVDAETAGEVFNNLSGGNGNVSLGQLLDGSTAFLGADGDQETANSWSEDEYASFLTSLVEDNTSQVAEFGDLANGGETDEAPESLSVDELANAVLPADADGSGGLNAEEYNGLTQSLGLSEEEASASFNALAGEDGEVSLGTFLSAALSEANINPETGEPTWNEDEYNNVLALLQSFNAEQPGGETPIEENPVGGCDH